MAEVLPFIRAEIARELVTIHKMNQSEVSRILGVSQPAVSQYIRQLRGAKLAYDISVRQDVKSLCEKLMNGRANVDLESELFSICKAVASDKGIK